jgi:hypothetical protein
MNKCSRHPKAAGTTSHQRSALPDHQRGHDLTKGLEVQARRVLTHQRLPDPILPHIRTRQLSLGQRVDPPDPGEPPEVGVVGVDGATELHRVGGQLCVRGQLCAGADGLE